MHRAVAIAPASEQVFDWHLLDSKNCGRLTQILLNVCTGSGVFSVRKYPAIAWLHQDVGAPLHELLDV